MMNAGIMRHLFLHFFVFIEFELVVYVFPRIHRTDLDVSA